MVWGEVVRVKGGEQLANCSVLYWRRSNLGKVKLFDHGVQFGTVTYRRVGSGPVFKFFSRDMIGWTGCSFEFGNITDF